MFGRSVCICTVYAAIHAAYLGLAPLETCIFVQVAQHARPVNVPFLPGQRISKLKTMM